jgi:tetratricopeptide (TPR) repeat protein
MKKKDKETVRLTLSGKKHLDTQLELHGQRYLVQTEPALKGPLIRTVVFRGGQVLLSRESRLCNAPTEEALKEAMLRQHEEVLQELKATPPVKSPSEYLQTAKTLLRRKNKQAALQCLSEALQHYPEEPFILSYWGCLQCMVHKNAQGIQACRRALKLLPQRVPFGVEVLIPTFYLNLARAYLAMGNKRSAVAALKKGLQTDKHHPELIWELKKLGIRRRPPVRFLSRSHPINKYIGMLLHKLKGPQDYPSQ